MSQLEPPPINREMKVLDRSFFQKSMQISAASVLDHSNIQLVRAKLKADLLTNSAVKIVRNDQHHRGGKCVLLAPSIHPDRPATWSEPCSQLVNDRVIEIHPYKLQLTYDDWSMGEILDAVLPELSDSEEQNPTGFAQVGHIAHLNLRNQFLPFKYLIGQVLLDKNPKVTTVINKLNDVGTTSTYRTFPYEVLAGVNDFNVTVNHANCEFTFNFAEVYWNTRLGHEHERLIEMVKPGETLCDVMAGVGPFAIPAGKKGVWVRANDLNPASYVAMQAAISRNKVGRYVTASCMDGAEFVRGAVKELLANPRTFVKKPEVKLSRHATPQQKAEALAKANASAVEMIEPPTFGHFVMNLPATAVEFLPVFRGLYHGKEDLFEPQGERKLPLIHVYAFQRRRENEDEERDELRQRLSHYLGYQLTADHEVHLHRARIVAPNKLYYCATFRLPPEVAFCQAQVTENSSAPATSEDAAP